MKKSRQLGVFADGGSSNGSQPAGLRKEAAENGSADTQGTSAQADQTKESASTMPRQNRQKQRQTIKEKRTAIRVN